MSIEKFCQSCSMPLDSNEIMGTEKNGSRNEEYCRYCYQDGKFTTPGMSLGEMEKLIKTQMEEMNIAPEIISKAVISLPHLKRWRTRDKGGVIL